MSMLYKDGNGTVKTVAKKYEGNTLSDTGFSSFESLTYTANVEQTMEEDGILIATLTINSEIDIYINGVLINLVCYRFTITSSPAQTASITTIFNKGDKVKISYPNQDVQVCYFKRMSI